MPRRPQHLLAGALAYPGPRRVGGGGPPHRGCLRLKHPERVRATSRARAPTRCRAAGYYDLPHRTPGSQGTGRLCQLICHLLRHVEAAFTVAPIAVGAIIFWRRPDDRMTFLVSLVLLMYWAGITFPYHLLELPRLWEALSAVVALIGVAAILLFRVRLPRRPLRAQLGTLASAGVDRGVCS